MPNKIALNVPYEKNNFKDLATAEKAPIDMANVCKNNDTFLQFVMKASTLKPIHFQEKQNNTTST